MVWRLGDQAFVPCGVIQIARPCEEYLRFERLRRKHRSEEVYERLRLSRPPDRVKRHTTRVSKKWISIVAS